MLDLRVLISVEECVMSRNAYHLYGNFGEHFPTSGTGVTFFVLKTVMGLKYTIYKITVSFRFLSRGSLALLIHTNGTENLGLFGKSRKK